MIRAAGDAHSYAEIEFPVGAEIQIDAGQELLLLVAQRIPVGERSEFAVILKSRGDAPGNVIADLEVGREGYTLANRGAVKGTVECGIEGHIQLTGLLVDDRAQFQGPGVGREDVALISEFGGKADAYWPFPGLRHADARTDVITHPL